jgi:hypothetical protein
LCPVGFGDRQLIVGDHIGAFARRTSLARP